MKFLYLHGLGQKPDSWDRVIKETKVSDSSVCLSLAEMLEDKAATIILGIHQPFGIAEERNSCTWTLRIKFIEQIGRAHV